MIFLKLISIALIFAVTILAGAYPFVKKIRTRVGLEFPIGEALASGVFLGAGLLHMLGDSAQNFINQGYDYPFAFLITGVMFLLLLSFEHIGREIYEHDGEQSPGFALLAVLMLSVHSFLAGAALGLSDALSVIVVILMAILAHKWAASFALAVQINKSMLSLKMGMSLFLVFAFMVPLGILFGDIINRHLAHYPLLEPVFSALAAGTFLYLGTLHGLKRAVMIEKCCDLRHFVFVIIGFAIMAVVAIWT